LQPDQYIRHGRRCRLHGRLARAQSAAGSPGLGTAWILYPEPAAGRTMFPTRSQDPVAHCAIHTRGTEQHANRRMYGMLAVTVVCIEPKRIDIFPFLRLTKCTGLGDFCFWRGGRTIPKFHAKSSIHTMCVDIGGN
jgi:hypothetical protein